MCANINTIEMHFWLPENRELILLARKNNRVHG
jgi:hypothetical protein